jgi:uncharacterized protein
MNPNTQDPTPRTRAKRLVIASLLALGARAQAPDLEPRGYTNDFAGALSPEVVQRLDRLAGEVQRKTGVQMAFVLIRSLQGQPIEDYSINLARRWGIGQRKENKGLLLLLVVDDRRSRLEVGYGLEPVLPDGRAGALLRSMRPALREGRYDDAVWGAATQIADLLAESAGVTLEGQPATPPPRSPAPGLPIWILALGAVGALWLVWKMGLGPLWWLSTLSGGWGGSHQSGGSSGWDGGGFGGFGGGDFGGGGASGDW